MWLWDLIKRLVPNEPGLPDLLVYERVLSDGTILLKCGSLLSLWEVEGEDFGCASDDECERANLWMGRALSLFGDGWTLGIDCIRQEFRDYRERRFPDETSRAIEQDRTRQWRGADHFTSRVILSITWKPDVEGGSWFWRMLETQDRILTDIDRLLERYYARIEDFRTAMSRVWTLRRLDIGDTIGHLATCINGYSTDVACGYKHNRISRHGGNCDFGDNRDRNSAALANDVAGLDYLLGQDFVPSFTPEVAGRHVRIVALNGLPAATQLDQARFLTEMCFPYRWHLRIQPKSQDTAHRILRGFRGQHDIQKDTAIGYTRAHLGKEAASRFKNRAAMKQADDADDALTENGLGAARFCYVTAKVVISEETPEKANMRQQQVFEALQTAHMNPRKETWNAAESWLESLPGDQERDVRLPLVSSRNVIDLLPLSHPYVGQNYNPCPYYPAKTPALFVASQTGGQPFQGCLHVGDVGHTLVCGPTGVGKTTLLNFLLASFRAMPNGQIFAVDKGRGGMGICQAMGGTHHDISGAVLDSWLYRGSRPALDDSLTMFEVDQLMSQEPYHVDTFLHQLFDAIEARLTGRPTLISLDEVWMLLALAGQSRTNFQRLAKLIREGRKHNAAVVLSTQSPTDVYNSPFRDILLESTPTKIWLPNAFAGSPQGSEVYRKFGLSEKQIREIAVREPKREYLFTQDGHEVWLDFEFSDETVRLLTQKGIHDGDSYLAAAGR